MWYFLFFRLFGNSKQVNIFVYIHSLTSFNYLLFDDKISDKFDFKLINLVILRQIKASCVSRQSTNDLTTTCRFLDNREMEMYVSVL